MKDGLTQKTINGFLWLLFGSGGQAILQLLVTAILARLLLPEEFGVVAAAMIVITFTELVYEIGIGPAIVQVKELHPKDIETAFTFSVLMGIVMSGLMYIFSVPVASFFKMANLDGVLRLMVWVFPFRTASQISYSLLQREMAFKKLAGLDIISYLIGFAVVGTALALLKYGVWALAWANLIQAIVYSLLLFFVKRHSIKFKIDFATLKRLLIFGGGYTFSQILNFLARKLDYIIVGRLLGASSLGFYSKAFALMNAPNNAVGTVMSKVLFVSYSKIQDTRARLTSALEKSYTLVMNLAVPFSAFGVILAPEIVYFLLGPKWNEAIVPFQILVAFMFCRVGYKIGGTLLKGIGKVYILSFTQFLYLCLVFLGAFIGSKYGIQGVALGVSIAIFINFMILVYCSFRFSDLRLAKFLIDFVRILGVTLIYVIFLVALTYWLRDHRFSPIFILIFSSLLLILITLLFFRFAPRVLVGSKGLEILKGKDIGIFRKAR